MPATVDAILKVEDPTATLVVKKVVTDAESSVGYADPVFDGGVRAALADLLLEVDGVETTLLDILTELGQKLEPGDTVSVAISQSQTLDTGNTKTIAAADASPGSPWVGAWTATRDEGYVRVLTVLASTASAGLGGAFTFQFSEDGATATVSEERGIGDFATVRDFDLLNAGKYYRVKFEPDVALGANLVFVTTTLRRQDDGAFVRLADQEIEKANAALPSVFSYLKAFSPSTGKSVNLLITDDGNLSVRLDATTLAALETIGLDTTTLTALETIGLDTTTLAALETTSITNFPADYPDAATLAKVEAVRALLAGTLAVSGPLTDAQLRAADVKVTLDGEIVSDGADEFWRIKNKRFADTEEVRYDLPTTYVSTSIYTGVATDATATSAASWTVIRTYFDANGNPSRERIRTAVVWDNRTAGWT